MLHPSCLVGVSPLLWSNDDFDALAGAAPLSAVLREMRQAGYAGTELGHAYPRRAAALAAELAHHGLRLATGWHSTFLAERDLDAEVASLRDHLELLKTLGARVAIIAECTHGIHSQPEAALGFDGEETPRFNESEWPRFAAGLRHLCAVAAREEMTLVYHPHLGTGVQSEADFERLLAAVPEIGWVLDPAHLAGAGIDPAAITRRHAARIGHVHLQDLRSDLAVRMRREEWSFHRAIREGVFAPPGEGSIDFPALFAVLAAADYRGWLIVEAEVDPGRSPALPAARAARDWLRRHAGV